MLLASVSVGNAKSRDWGLMHYRFKNIPCWQCQGEAGLTKGAPVAWTTPPGSTFQKSTARFFNGKNKKLISRLVPYFF